MSSVTAAIRQRSRSSACTPPSHVLSPYWTQHKVSAKAASLLLAQRSQLSQTESGHQGLHKAAFKLNVQNGRSMPALSRSGLLSSIQAGKPGPCKVLGTLHMSFDFHLERMIHRNRPKGLCSLSCQNSRRQACHNGYHGLSQYHMRHAQHKAQLSMASDSGQV